MTGGYATVHVFANVWNDIGLLTAHSIAASRPQQRETIRHKSSSTATLNYFTADTWAIVCNHGGLQLLRMSGGPIWWSPTWRSVQDDSEVQPHIWKDELSAIAINHSSARMRQSIESKTTIINLPWRWSGTTTHCDPPEVVAKLCLSTVLCFRFMFWAQWLETMRSYVFNFDSSGHGLN